MARGTFAYWHIAGVIEAAVFVSRLGKADQQITELRSSQRRARNYTALAKPLSHGRSVVASPTSAPWI